MGCSSSRYGAEETFCRNMYKHFTSGQPGKIVEAMAEGGTFECPGTAPYCGTYKQGDKEGKSVADFFAAVEKNWGDEKKPPKIITFEPSGFSVEGNKVTNKVYLRVLTSTGKVIIGSEDHTWTLSDDKKKITAFKVDQKIHDAAFADDANQAVLMAKLCWSLFEKGKHKEIVEQTQTKESKFSLFKDSQDDKVKDVPYAGVFVGAKMMEAFKAMTESWIFNDEFKFAPDEEFKGVDATTCIMNAKGNIPVKGGKVIKFDQEGHKCVITTTEAGHVQVTSWDVTGSGEKHAAGFAKAAEGA